MSTTTAKLAVDVEGLRKCFGTFCAVDGVSFTVAPGEVFGLLGPNGAGKSTTIRMLTTLVPPSLQWVRRWYAKRIPHDGSIEAARQNIHHHYDLSNELFAAFLDETMTYSSAMFAGGDTLANAQRRKIDRLLDLAEVGPGSRVLEIGTGWGELAIRAAARGARVTSITISEEQRKLAIERVADAGYTGSVAVELRDYREAQGYYDAVVSVEMIEAVGE